MIKVCIEFFLSDFMNVKNTVQIGLFLRLGGRVCDGDKAKNVTISLKENRKSMPETILLEQCLV